MKKEEKIIFTDLDGTLLDERYSFEKAKPALHEIKKHKIPLVICTSKTRAEIELYRKKLRNKHPFISENGGAIFIPKKYFKIKFPYHRNIRGYYVIELGLRYSILVKELEKIKQKTKAQIISFEDMSLEDLMEDSGLHKKQASLAKKREYDLPFKIIGKGKEKQILKLIKKLKLNYTKGGRYYHLVGRNDKGKAVEILAKLYEKDLGAKVKTISLGDSLNDKAMLLKTNKAFLVQKPNKRFARIKNKKIKKIKGVGPEAWNKIVLNLLWEFNEKKAEQIYKKSIEVLKNFQLKNGAILASSPKGRYPYVYPRDHSICTLALIDAGLLKRAKKAIEFILKTQNKDGSFPQRVDEKGRDMSYKPLQLDNTGLVLYSVALYTKKTKDSFFTKKYSIKIKKSIKYIESRLNKDKYLFFTPNSIHEFPPYEEGLEIWANAVCYGSLKEISELGFSSKINLKKLKNSIINHFWNGRYFIKNIRLREASSVVKDIDASIIALSYFNVLRDDNEKLKKSILIIEKKLWHKKLGGICRYEEHIGRNNGGYGPWPHFTLMVAKHYIRLRERKKAEEYIEWVLDIAENNLLPEHIATKKDFERWVKDYRKAGILRKDREVMINNIRKTKSYKKGIAYSVLPLAWPHAEFIRTWLLFKKEFIK